MRKKLLIMTLTLTALLGLTTLYAGAASGGESTNTIYVGAGQPFDTLDGALNYAVRTRGGADSVEIILQSDTTMNTTARSLPQDVTIKSEGDTPYTITNTADFVVDNDCSLTLENVTFASTTTRDFEITNGTLVTNGAVTLAGNRVVVWPGGSSTLNDGTIISGNTAEYGGGVYVYSGGTFIMNGGTISSNTATHWSNGAGGGGVYNSGTFTMSGGTISGNTATASYGGGGVYIGPGGTFNMTGGIITGNYSNGTATSDCGGGAGVYVNAAGGSAIFNMYDGTISDNRAASYSGGVHVTNGGIFNMYGGTISGNFAPGTGGVSSNPNATFTMSGGTITGNEGGGVSMQGTLRLSGAVVIRDNHLTNGTDSNLNKVGNIIVTAPLTDGADVWVTNPNNEGAVFATANSPDIAAASALYFRNDVNPLTGKADGNNLIWVRFVAELMSNGTVHGRYATLDEAIAAYTDSATEMILLVEPITDPSTVDKDIYLDLNGKNITGALTVEDGCTVHGLDSATDGYTGTDYGKISTISGGGTVAPYTDTEKAHTTKEKHYITVKESDGTTSFHRYNVQVKDYYFRLVYDENGTSSTDIAMMNFGAAVQGGSKVADAVTGLELSSTPDDGSPPTTTSASSSLADLKTALSAGNPYYYRSHFIFPTNPYTAQYVLKVSLTLDISNNQTATASAVRNYSLVEILEIFYKTADADQKSVINKFLSRNGLAPFS